MGVAQAKNLMAEMKFHGMLKGFDRIINIAQNDSWGNIEIIDALLQEEYDSRKARKIESKIKTSKLRLKPELEDFDFTAGRSITKAEIKDLYKLDWANKGRAILLIGPTGIGKTFIAQALGLHACRNGYSVIFMSVTNFLENIMLARSSATYLKFRDKLIKPDVFILDDLGLRKFTAMESQDLCEILEERSLNKSTIITSQLPVENWHEVIPDPVIADAIIDRVIHSKITIKIKGPSYRGVIAKKLDKNKKV
jgi:DNA replication protein DnaC